MTRGKFKGPSRFRWTGKRGFLVGLLLGGSGWWVQHGSDPLLASELTVLRAFLVLVSAGLVFLQYFRGKTTLTPAGDGFVYGFTASFDILGWVSTGMIP